MFGGWLLLLLFGRRTPAPPPTPTHAPLRWARPASAPLSWSRPDHALTWARPDREPLTWAREN